MTTATSDVETSCHAASRAVIFDMDGVLVDSYHAHLRSWQEVGRETGIDITEQAFAGTFGRTSRETIETLWQGRGLTPDDVRRIDDRKESIFRELLARDVPVMAGAQETLAAFRNAGWQLAIGSSGPPPNVALVVDAIGGRQVFDAIVTGADVSCGKPDPEVFLYAAQRLAIKPARCLVVEDAPAGVQAATRAGMRTIALLSTGRARHDFQHAEAQPVLFAESLATITPALAESILMQ